MKRLKDKLLSLGIQIIIDDDKFNRFQSDYKYSITLNVNPYSAYFGTGATEEVAIYQAITRLPKCLKDKL